MSGDPRRVGDHCLFGYNQRRYTVLGWDGVDWQIVWDDGRCAMLSRYWNPTAGDRVLEHTRRRRPPHEPVQLPLFVRGA